MKFYIPLFVQKRRRPRTRWLFLGIATFIAVVALILFAVTVAVGGTNLKAILESGDPNSAGVSNACVQCCTLQDRVF
jgi:hypothetical protein